MGRIVRMVIVAVTVSFVVASGVQAAMGHRDLAILLALAAPLGISAWGFARGGYDEAAVILLCAVLVTVTSLILFQSPKGVHDHAVAIYTGVLFFSSLLLSRRAFLGVAALTLGAGTLLFVFDILRMTHSRIGNLTGWAALAEFLMINGVACVLARAVAEILFDHLGEAQRASVRDAATGLTYREQFLMQAGLRLRHAEPGAEFGVLAVADLDTFRRVNHLVGHLAADRILAEAAARVAMFGAEAGAVAGRIGDDEFAVLVTGLPEASAAPDVARQLSEALRFEHAGVSVSATVGYASYPSDGPGIDGLLLAADAVLADAKARATGAA